VAWQGHLSSDTCGTAPSMTCLERLVAATLLSWSDGACLQIIRLVLLFAVALSGILGGKQIIPSKLAIVLMASCFCFFGAACISFTSGKGYIESAKASLAARCAVVIVTLLTVSLPWTMNGPEAIQLCDEHFESLGEDKQPFWKHLHLLQDVIKLCLLAVVVVASLSSRHEPSGYIRAAVMCEVMIWMSAVGWTSFGFADWCGGIGLLTDVLFGAAFSFMVVGFLGSCLLIMLRVEVLQKALGSRSCWPMRGVIISYCCLYYFQCILQVLDMHPPVIGVILASCPLAASGFALAVYLPAVRRLWKETGRSTGAALAHAEWARKTLSIELAAALFACFSFFLKLAYDPISWHHGEVGSFALGCLGSMDDLANAVGVAITCGLFRRWRLLPPDLQQVRKLTSEAPAMNDSVTANPAWAAKIEELAGRGFALEALMRFHKALLEGNIMPHFDPYVSTMHDVVRQVVIPLSRSEDPAGGGRAMASLWNDGAHVVPQRMVTHNWSNLFVHTLAAIVADALGQQGGYADLAEELCTAAGVAMVMMKARALGVLGMTYWVCAFSVNQHASICGGFGPCPPRGTPERAEWEARRRDTTTGRKIAVCDCSEPKHFNTDVYECELNKFNAMMQHLADKVTDFGQVVVVDERFELFSRAWCVAELVEADFKGIPQSIQIHSNKAIDLHYSCLATLDVQQCRASRPEDKDFILERIEDVVAFNEKLQILVLSENGLLKDCVDPLQRASIIAQMVERSKIRCQGPRSESVPQSTVSEPETVQTSSSETSSEDRSITHA